MSHAAGPGDFVECIDDSGAAAPYIRDGALYCVEAIDTAAPDACLRCGPGKGCAGYALTGILTADPIFGRLFCEGRFRPIYRRDEGLIQSLLEPVIEPTYEKEPA